MLAFFVPALVSRHLPSSINTPLKGSLLLASNGGHTPPVEILFCLLRGVESCFRLGVINSPAGACSLAYQKNQLAKAGFFVPAIFPIPFALPASIVQSKNHNAYFTC